MSQNKKVALVTGAGSGIGRAVALALLEDNFSLVLAGRRAEPLQAVVEQALAAGGEALAVPTDVRDEQSVAHLFATIEEVHGRLDVMFNNAGINAPLYPSTSCRWRTGATSSPPTSMVYSCAPAPPSALCVASSRKAGGSSTTARSRRTPHARSPHLTPPASMRCWA